MTPKEKAKELVDKYKPVINEISDLDTEYYYHIQAWKQCALIVVDEILKVRSLNKQKSGYEIINNGYIEYWQEVKQEIEAL